MTCRYIISDYALRSAGTGGGLLLPPAFFRLQRREVLRQTGASNSRDSPAISLQRIVPADDAGGGVQAKNLAMRGRQKIIPVEDDVGEISALQLPLPNLFTRGGVQGDHRSPDADKDEL
jgi:hypothetical protein